VQNTRLTLCNQPRFARCLLGAELHQPPCNLIATCRGMSRPVPPPCCRKRCAADFHIHSSKGDKHRVPRRAPRIMYRMEFRQERHIGDILKERNIEIIGADLATRHGFTQVPNFILTKADISVGAKLAYAMLLKYAWGDDACFPGQTKLADDMGSGERSVRRYLEELEKANLLEIVQRGLGKTNLYRLFLTIQKHPTHGRR